MSKKKVIIDPYTNILYASFYILGLTKIFGKRNISFSSKPFKHFSFLDRRISINFIIKDNENEKKISLYFDDSYQIRQELYEWCDVYGSVNANFEQISEIYHEKLVSLCPSFGVRLWSFFHTVYYCVSNLAKSKLKISEFKKYIGKYKRLYLLRTKYEDYIEQNEVINNYIFHLSTLWYNDEWNKNDVGVNRQRALFIRACKATKNIIFEGGLVSDRTDEAHIQFADCFFYKQISINEYLDKIKKSIIVFNTPAFWNCHGWKLGEYLALGKAIISTPLFNDLPCPLSHGENIHFVSNDNELIAAIQFIIDNPEYRKKLELGAKKYWNEYGEPVQSLGLLGF